jgi:hypothetical protein
MKISYFICISGKFGSAFFNSVNSFAVAMQWSQVGAKKQSIFFHHLFLESILNKLI